MITNEFASNLCWLTWYVAAKRRSSTLHLARKQVITTTLHLTLVVLLNKMQMKTLNRLATVLRLFNSISKTLVLTKLSRRDWFQNLKLGLLGKVFSLRAQIWHNLRISLTQ